LEGKGQAALVHAVKGHEECGHWRKWMVSLTPRPLC